jgi:hypothetical protein
VAERIGEASLPVRAPRRLVRWNRIARSLSAVVNGAEDDGIRIIDEKLDTDGGRPERSRGSKAVGLLVKKEACTLKVERPNRA